MDKDWSCGYPDNCPNKPLNGLLSGYQRIGKNGIEDAPAPNYAAGEDNDGHDLFKVTAHKQGNYHATSFSYPDEENKDQATYSDQKTRPPYVMAHLGDFVGYKAEFVCRANQPQSDQNRAEYKTYTPNKLIEHAQDLAHTLAVMSHDMPKTYELTRKQIMRELQEVLGNHFLINTVTHDATDAEFGAHNIVQEILFEVIQSRHAHPKWPIDPLHALAILGEEFGKLTKEVLRLAHEPHRASYKAMRSEANQTAAMVVRFILNIDSYDPNQCKMHKDS